MPIIIASLFISPWRKAKNEMQDIAGKMHNYKGQTIYTGHYTGQKGYAVLKSVVGEKLQHLHTGTIIIKPEAYT
jgi:7,8-dihydropterin-6-yl-methyl-4-(beta-D-ribofuranosyl)aminobenzene 5'-phosphate synthase